MMPIAQGQSVSSSYENTKGRIDGKFLILQLATLTLQG
jgi:hypothetical protein